MSSDVWESSEAADAAAQLDLAGGTSGALDSPLDVASAVWNDFKNHIMGYLMAGLAYLAVTMVVVFFCISALGLMIPGALMEDEALIAIGGIAGFSIYTIGLFAFSFLGVPLLTASLMRAIDAQARGEGEIGFLSLTSTARENAGYVIIFYLMGQTVVLIGFMLLYIPGFIAAVVVSFAMPIVVLDGLSPVDALKKSWEHVSANPAWHFGVWASLFAALIVGELTIVGLLVLFPVMVAWQVHAHRIAFGD